MTIKNKLQNLGTGIKKHSPAIYTSVGIVGLGATAYLAYKSRDKVEVIVDEIEEKRANGEDVNKVEVVKDFTEAMILPITVGALSVTSIIMSHKIQRNRILALSGALAAQQARNIYFEQRYKQLHGEEKYEEFITPVNRIEEEETDKNGKTKVKITEVKKDVDRTIGQWYDESSEYASDDHTYNIAYIDSVNERMQTLLFQRGTLLLNEVREALGFERTRSGALLGWTAAHSFEIEKVVTMLGDEDLGESKEQIWITWSRPSYIYDDVEFNGRYAVL